MHFVSHWSLRSSLCPLPRLVTHTHTPAQTPFVGRALASLCRAASATAHWAPSASAQNLVGEGRILEPSGQAAWGQSWIRSPSSCQGSQLPGVDGPPLGCLAKAAPGVVGAPLLASSSPAAPSSHSPVASMHLGPPPLQFGRGCPIQAGEMSDTVISRVTLQIRAIQMRLDLGPRCGPGTGDGTAWVSDVRGPSEQPVPPGSCWFPPTTAPPSLQVVRWGPCCPLTPAP